MSPLELCDSISRAERAQTEAFIDLADSEKALLRLFSSFETCQRAMTWANVLDYLNEVRAEYQQYLDALERWGTARDMVVELNRELELLVLA